MTDQCSYQELAAHSVRSIEPIVTRAATIGSRQPEASAALARAITTSLDLTVVVPSAVAHAG
jgi:hypothetical protein